MEERTAIPAREELELSLKEIRGVLAARVITQEGEITEVHILAEPDRNPKQVVRDIESALQARYAIAIDHKKVSVAQVNDNGGGPLEKRPRFSSLGFSIKGSQAHVQVELEFAHQKYQGEAKGPGTSSNKLRLAAMATLQAIEGFPRNRCSFILEDVALVPMGRWEAVVVLLSALNGHQEEEKLVGAVLVDEDRLEAVVKGVLAAVNRRLSVLLG